MHAKNCFLKRTNAENENDAMNNAITSALRRNPTYRQNISNSDKKDFRNTLANCVKKYAASYSGSVSDAVHIKNIIRIRNEISKVHGKILKKNRLKLGTAQKVFNLYLKFLWCLGETAEPPHCPVDAIVLKNAKLKGSWTTLDSVDTYKDWIKQIKAVARGSAWKTIQQWELAIWNKSS